MDWRGGGRISYEKEYASSCMCLERSTERAHVSILLERVLWLSVRLYWVVDLSSNPCGTACSAVQRESAGGWRC